MKKKVLIITSIICLFSSTVAFAASVNGSFAGFPIANVIVNDDKLTPNVPGIVVQGSTMLPAKAIAESLNAVVTWDQATMTASIQKPDVNIVFADEIIENKDGSWDIKNPYSICAPGQGQEVVLFIQVGPMKKDLYEYRVLVREPNGDILETSAVDNFEIDSSGMMANFTLSDLDFKKVGLYKFEFQIKYYNEFKTVEDKMLLVE
jgi:hypothetical protein